MKRIKILDSHCVNQIAAGEVVERPLSVVKELVENALDAAAKVVEIAIEGGGTALIKVRDDGVGIPPDDLRLAVLPHATSKIKTIDDLERLHTLGFRGEALPSIASVSRMSILSRTADSVSGYEIVLKGGRVQSLSASASSVGTIVTVQDLFFNTPARQKFLKSASAEFGAVSDMVSRLALARPDIAFVLRHNNKTVLRTPGNNKLVDAAGAVLGNDTARRLLPLSYDVQAEEAIAIGLHGLISPPDLIRSSRTGLTFVINGRVIFSNILANAVKAGYHTLIPAGSYPLAVVHLTMNPADYDVNVHPAKLEVKFHEEKRLTGILTEAIQATLLRQKPVRSLTPATGKPAENRMITDFAAETDPGAIDSAIAKDSAPAHSTTANAQGPVHTAKPEEPGSKYDDRLRVSEQARPYKSPGNGFAGSIEQLKMIYQAEPNSLSLNIPDLDTLGPDTASADAPNTDTLDSGMPAVQDSGANNSGDSSDLAPAADDQTGDRRDAFHFYHLRALSQIFGTYILAADEHHLYIIDQHAAHERIRYEKLLAKLEAGTPSSQILLVPEVVELTLQEEQIMLDNLEALQDLGFVMEHFGERTYLLRGVPLLGDAAAPTKLFKLFFDEVLTKGQLPAKQTLLERWVFTLACRTSIKGNERLSVAEMDELIQSLGRTTSPYSCPHGRPIVIELSRDYLEKLFYR